MEQILTKNETIAKIKKGSMIIGVLCLITAVFYALLAFTPLGFGSAANNADRLQRAAIVRVRTEFALNFSTMLCAAAVFYRIHRHGRPFSRGNIMIVRTMGGLTIANSILPVFLYSVMLNDAKSFVGMFGAGSIVSGLLILFIAQIMRYGAMLQQESDETL